MRRAWQLATWLGALVCAVNADAHLMPSGEGSARIVDDSVYLALAVPTGALVDWDDNGDTYIDMTELTRHRDELLTQLSLRVRQFDEQRPGRLIFEDLLFEESEAGATLSRQLLLMRRVQWPGPLQSLQIELDTFDATVPALTLKALRGNSTEVAIYTSHQSQHEFFQGFFRSLTQFIGVGVEHILGGADHLLFLLTVLIAGAGWRYWIGVISSFTLAHSLSLTCAVLGWVQISPRVVEPCIAASIVFMALDNLWRGQVNTRQRMLLVFGCGLLHGLGFASAIASLGASGHSLWASLLGFNLGVEFGQLIFIAVSLTALGILPKLIRSWQPPSLARALSIGAVLAASAMLLQRVG